MKKKIKILIALIVGFALAMLLMSVAIYFGYTNAYSTDVNTLTVSCPLSYYGRIGDYP